MALQEPVDAPGNREHERLQTPARREAVFRAGLWTAGLLWVAIILAGLLFLFLSQYDIGATLYAWTGEENRLSQLHGLYGLALTALRPRPDTQPDVPIAYTGMNPFGINTFLEQEVEPQKRDRSLQLIAEAGYHWIRQEFPWYDIEIHGKGDFEDRRHQPYRSAWDKYDNIVDLAQKHGLDLIVRLSSPPSWSRKDGNARGAFAPPDNFQDYADYVAAVVERYKGRVRYYQIWNEPNIYPEWGNQPADPEGYTRLLCTAYQRVKQVDPQAVVLSATLAPTVELNGPGPEGSTQLNDFIFLQRMYDAGAGKCFDILAVQGYGLWSGPTDHRQQPLNLNVARNVQIRDLMVKNGDANKPIWITEMNWDAVPTSMADTRFGRVTLEQQAQYLPEAYTRIQQDWPWVGVAVTWFFKRPSDAEKDQSWYYFRLVEPNFQPMPVYNAMSGYANSPPVLYPGFHQEDDWAVHYSDGWQEVTDPAAVLGGMKASPSDSATASFTFEGSGLRLVVAHRPNGGVLVVQVDGTQVKSLDLNGAPSAGMVEPVVVGLPSGRHAVRLSNVLNGRPSGPLYIDGFIVDRQKDWLWSLLPP